MIYNSTHYKLLTNMGFLLINKPAGITSHDVVDRVRAITGVRKVGHSGTLDPFATGLLIVAVGRESTKRLGEFLKLDKKYRATIHFGATSDTQDKTGVITPTCHSGAERTPTTCHSEAERSGVIESSQSKDEILSLASSLQDDRGVDVGGNDVLVDLDDIVDVLAQFIGDIEQIPPMYSAKKVGGKKLYELARAGKEIERKPHAITIHSIDLVSFDWPLAAIDVHCSSGTYIRTLCADVGERLGVCAYCEELERTAIGTHLLSDTVNLDELTSENWRRCLRELT